jgi:hypothetical protein
MSARKKVQYSPEIAAKLCAELSAGKSLLRVCKMEGMPGRRTVFDWMESHPEFLQLYQVAKNEAADLYAEEIIEIADDGRNDYMESQQDGGGVAYKFMGEHVQRSRLRVDARKWIVSKLMPKKYGDKVTTEHTGANGGPIQYVARLPEPCKSAEEWLNKNK